MLVEYDLMSIVGLIDGKSYFTHVVQGSRNPRRIGSVYSVKTTVHKAAYWLGKYHTALYI